MTNADEVVVTCDDCEMERRTTDVADAIEFAVKHHEHTGHEVSWEQVPLVDGVVSVPRTEKWEVSCETCDLTRYFDTEARAHEFADEHEEFAGHDVTAIEHRETGEIEESAIHDVIEYLFEHSAPVNVVPQGAVIEAFHETGVPERKVARHLATAIPESDAYALGEGYLGRRRQ